MRFLWKPSHALCDNQLFSYFISHYWCGEAEFQHILDDSVSLFFSSSANPWAAPGRRWRTTWGTRDIRWSDSFPTLFIFLLFERSTLMAWVTPAPSQSRSGRRVSDEKVTKSLSKIILMAIMTIFLGYLRLHLYFLSIVVQTSVVAAL